MNTWACTDIPGGNNCGNRTVWRQLTKAYDGHADGWQYNSSTKRIELRSGLSTSGFPAGTYTMYVANGQNGASSSVGFTLQSASSSTSTANSCSWEWHAVI